MRKPLLTVIAGVWLIGGCASVNPAPITSANHATMKGIRYYEARPFIAVHRPFVLDSESYLVDGIVSSDGQWVRITGEVDRLGGEHKPFEHARDGLTLQEISTSSILVVDPPEGSTGDDIPDSQSEGGDNIPDAQSEGGDADKPPPLKTGTATVTVQTDLLGVGFFPVSESYSIIYLPDYDREFVIDTDADFGTLTVDLKRGPGGVLLAMSAEVDNSAITGPLIQAYGDVLGTLSEAAQLAIRAATGVPIPGAEVVAPPVAQSEGAVSHVREMTGRAITLRVHVVKFAALGVYPLIKPNEVADYKNSEQDLVDHNYIVPVRQYHVPYKYFKILVVEHIVGGAAQFTQGSRAKPADKQKIAFDTLMGQNKEDQIGALNRGLGGGDPPFLVTDCSASRDEAGAAQLSVTIAPETPGDSPDVQAVKDALRESYGVEAEVIVAES